VKKLIIFISVILILVIAYFVGQSIATNKVEKALAKEIDFEEVDVSLWSGKLEVKQPTYQKNNSVIKSDKAQISGFSYYQFLVNDKIEIDRLLIDDAVVNIQQNKEKDSSENSSSKKFNKNVVVKKVELNGSLIYRQDSLKFLTAENFKISIDSVGLNNETIKSKIPFNYKDFKVEISQVDYTLNQLQDLAVKYIELDPSKLVLKNIDYKPKLSKEDYIEVIPYEKDLMNLNLKQLTINNYDLKFQEDQPQFTANYIELDSIDFWIYRDKTVKDDVRKKDMYSKMLREMKLKLAIDSLKVKNTHLDYQEMINKNRAPGRIFFDNLNLSMYNVTNINLDRKDFPETHVDIQTKFMGKSNFDVDWDFKINDKNDVFTIKGQTFNIPESSINSFFVPAFGMRTEGEVSELYFNFRGNATQASGELQIAYENFKVEVLKKDSDDKNTILSALANLIVKKNSKKNGETTKNPKAVQRDQTKSFWNYFWKCLEAGLREALMIF